MKSTYPARFADLKFVIGALIAVGVLLVFVGALHAF
jgi:hypothetical protein